MTAHAGELRHLRQRRGPVEREEMLQLLVIPEMSEEI